MKIAFSIISNRPDRLYQFLTGLINTALLPEIQYSFCFVLQPPCDERTDELIHFLLRGRQVRIKHCNTYHRNGVTYICEARTDAYNLCEDEDYVIICDDDNVFKGGTKSAQYTSADRIKDAIDYMEANQDCGVIQLRGFFGGAPFGRQIVPFMEKGYYATEYGIVIRGQKQRAFPLIDNDLMAPGATSDVMIFFTTIANGYYAAKAFNCPIHKVGTNKIVPNNENVHYDYNFIYGPEGIQTRFAKKFPPGWKLGGRLPKSLLDEFERKRRERENQNRL